MSARLTRCRNCGELPEIVQQKGRYPFRLQHKEQSTCAPWFKLESHQKTRDLCVRDWNEFNARNRDD